MLVRPFVSRVCLLFAVSLPACESQKKKILKVTSVENTEKFFKTLTSRTKDGERKSESESEIGVFCYITTIENTVHVF
jgi:hypothetical protein